MPEDWRRDAACFGLPTEDFFPDQYDRFGERDAKAVCARCTVRQQCGDYALADPELRGIWGGLSRSQRLRLGRARRDAERTERRSA